MNPTSQLDFHWTLIRHYHELPPRDIKHRRFIEAQVLHHFMCVNMLLQKQRSMQAALAH